MKKKPQTDISDLHQKSVDFLENNPDFPIHLGDVMLSYINLLKEHAQKNDYKLDFFIYNVTPNIFMAVLHSLSDEARDNIISTFLFNLKQKGWLSPNLERIKNV